MSDPLVTVVLTALAGVRRGQRIATVGAEPVTTAALLAASGTTAEVDGDADVVVAGAPYDVPAALGKLAPGGRLVALAADAGAARRLATGAGLQLRHVQAVDARVAWSAVRPLGPPVPPVGGGTALRGTLDG